MPKGIPKNGRKPGNPNIRNIGKETRFTKENAAENGKKGTSSATALKKTFSDYFEDVLSRKNSKGATYKEGIAMAITNRALNGDAQAAQLCMRMVHELPNEKVNLSVEKLDTAALDELEGVVLNDQRTGD